MRSFNKIRTFISNFKKLPLFTSSCQENWKGLKDFLCGCWKNFLSIFKPRFERFVILSSHGHKEPKVFNQSLMSKSRTDKHNPIRMINAHLDAIRTATRVLFTFKNNYKLFNTIEFECTWVSAIQLQIQLNFKLVQVHFPEMSRIMLILKGFSSMISFSLC